jgi:transposase-like protein
VARKLGITEQTYYRWRKESGGLRSDQAQRLLELERENARLKKLLAEQTHDNAIQEDCANSRPFSPAAFGDRQNKQRFPLSAQSTDVRFSPI